MSYDYNFIVASINKLRQSSYCGEEDKESDGERRLPRLDELLFQASHCINPRDLYSHKPARTLTCRNIAAPTGDMQRVCLKDGRRRRISIREAARLQSFPDWFEFLGTETNQYYQIGNAVAPLLAFQIAQKIHNCLANNSLPPKNILKNMFIGQQMQLF